MLQLSENEYWASFDIRNQLVTHGRLDNKFLKNVISFKSYDEGSLYWNLYPKDFEGLFSDEMEKYFGLMLSQYDSFEEFMCHLNTKVDDHTFLRTYIKDFKSTDWGLKRFIYKEGRNNRDFERSNRRFHKKVSYCPACMETKVIKYGHTFFSTNLCTLSSEGHINIELIGCPSCHYNHHQTPKVNNPRYGYKNTGIRIIDTLRGECRFCNCSIWQEAPRYLDLNRSHEIYKAIARSNTILAYFMSGNKK